MLLRVNVLFILLFFVVKSLCNSDVIVNTDKGKVAGTVVKSVIPNEKYFSFLGIPYASPPVEDLRFLPPKPHDHWDNVLICKKERPQCIQLDTRTRKQQNSATLGSEDCLYLNVHTPKLPQGHHDKLPIIFLVKNEQFKSSTNFSDEYSPDFFMKEGIIVVHINHRLNSLGFLSFEDDLIPGNNGIRDVLFALQWVQTNIEAFGGDPTKVTLMGYQGGAVIADILLHSTKAKGLFRNAIIKSGTSWNSVFFGGKARHRAKQLAEILEWGTSNSETFLKYLKPIDVYDIISNETKTVHADEARAIQKGVPDFGPVIEHEHADAIITKLPEESVVINDIPIMIGYNSREALDACIRYLHKPNFLTYADRDFLFMWPIRTKFHFKINDKVYYEGVEEIKDRYFEEGYVKISQPGEYVSYIQDAVHMYPVDYTVRQYVEQMKSPVYYYTFDYSGEWNQRKKEILEMATNVDGTWGAAIADDLCYLFVCNKYKALYSKAFNDDESEELQVLRNMVMLYSNFVKTGNPTPAESEFIWKPATKENKECLVVNEDLQLKTNVHEETITFWDNFMEKYEKKAVDGIIKDPKDEL